MTNCLFGLPSENWAIASALSASAAVAGLGADQLANPHGATSTSWQTPVGTTTAHVQVDAGSAKFWGAAALCRTNLTAAATIRWRLSSAADFATNLYDSGSLSGQVADGYGQAVHVLPARTQARYLRIDIADADNPEAVLRAGILFAGDVRVPAGQFGYDTAFSRVEARDVFTSRGGQEFPELRFARRAWQITLPFLSRADAWDLAMELQRDAAAGGNVLFVPAPGGTYQPREAVLGPLSGGPLARIPGAPLKRAWSATISERL